MHIKRYISIWNLKTLLSVLFRNPGMHVVYIWKWSSAQELGGVSDVASFITTDEQLQ